MRIELVDTLLSVSGKLARGIEESRRILDRARTIEDVALQAKSERVLGVLLRMTGDVDGSLLRLHSALKHYEQLQDVPGRGQSLAALAVLHDEQGRHSEAIEVYEQARALHRAAGNRMNEAKAIGGQAIACIRMGDRARARPLVEHALAIFQAEGDPRSEGIALGSLGIIHKLDGDLEAAERYYEAALAIHQRIGDRQLEATILGNLGNLASARGHEPAALGLHAGSIAIFREIGDVLSQAICLCNIADLHRRAGRLEESLDLLQQASALYHANHHKNRHAEVVIAIADTQRLLKERKERGHSSLPLR